MFCKWIIVVRTYDLVTDNIWDVWEASVLEHSFDVLPLFWKVCSSECLGFLVIVLQLEKSKFQFFDIGVKTLNSYIVLERVSELAQLEKKSRSIYEDLVEKRELAHQKTRYSGQQRLQAV